MSPINHMSLLPFRFFSIFRMVLCILSTSTQTGTREQAYVYAMSAAALAWSIARACAAGSLAACSCAAPPRAPPRPPRQAQVTPAEPHARFKWGGCGDNYQWAERYGGYAISREVAKDICRDSNCIQAKIDSKYVYILFSRAHTL